MFIWALGFKWLSKDTIIIIIIIITSLTSLKDKDNPDII